MENFRKSLEDNNQYDLGWMEDKFTQSNKHIDETFIKEWIDRAIANPQWLEVYKEEVWVDGLIARSSDYKPILLRMNNYCQKTKQRTKYLDMKQDGQQMKDVRG